MGEMQDESSGGDGDQDERGGGDGYLFDWNLDDALHRNLHFLDEEVSPPRLTDAIRTNAAHRSDRRLGSSRGGSPLRRRGAFRLRTPFLAGLGAEVGQAAAVLLMPALELAYSPLVQARGPA